MRRWMRALRGSTALVPVTLALLGSGACSAKKNTELMIAIQTDLSTPKDLDGIRVEVTSNGVVQFRQDYLNVGGDGVHLPASIGIQPSDREPRSVDIQIIGVKGNQKKILRRARTTFAKDRVALLRLPLRFSCYNKALDCPDGQSCIAGECKDATVIVEKLPDFESQEQISGKQTTGTSTEPDGCWDPQACLSPSTELKPSADDRCVFDISAVPDVATKGLTVVLATRNGQLGFCDSTNTCRVPLDQDTDEGWDFTDPSHTKIRIAKGVCDSITAETTVSVTSQCGTKTIVRPFCDIAKPTVEDTGTPPMDTTVEDTMPDTTTMADTSMPPDTSVMDTMVDTGPVVTAHDPGASMASARSRHVGVSFPDGTYGVFGGYEASTGVADSTCEVYDPATGKWTTGKPMVTARYTAAAGLVGSTNHVIVVGGRNGTGALSTAEIMLGPGGDWSPGPSIPDGPRPGGHTLTKLSTGELLLTGGQGAPYIGTSYKLSTDGTTWTTAAPMSIGRAFHSATLLASGKVLVAGGESDSGFVSTAEIYDPGTDTWTAAKSLSATRSRHQATLLPDGRVLVTGGGLKTAEIYNPTTNNWALAGSESDARGNHVAILLPDGKVFVAGGEPGGITTTEIWDPATGVWTPGAAMLAGRTELTGVLFNKSPGGSFKYSVFLVGGKSSSASLSTTELFNF